MNILLRMMDPKSDRSDDHARGIVTIIHTMTVAGGLVIGNLPKAASRIVTLRDWSWSSWYRCYATAESMSMAFLNDIAYAQMDTEQLFDKFTMAQQASLPERFTISPLDPFESIVADRCSSPDGINRGNIMWSSWIRFLSIPQNTIAELIPRNKLYMFKVPGLPESQARESTPRRLRQVEAKSASLCASSWKPSIHKCLQVAAQVCLLEACKDLGSIRRHKNSQPTARWHFQGRPLSQIAWS